MTLLVLLTGLFYWRYTLSNSFTFLETPDGANQVLPWLDFQARAWKQAPFPLWAPNQWGGQPLLGLMQPGAAFPPNWPLFALPLGEDGHIQLRFIHWQQTLLRLLGGLFAFALARELRISRGGALFAGLAFACVGAISSNGWPQIVGGMIWAPAAGLCVARLLREEHGADRLWHSALCGAVLGVALLSGHPRAPLFLAFAVSGMVAWAAIRRKDGALLASIPVIATTALCAGALQALPAWEYGQDAVRWVNLERPIGFDESIPYYIDEALRLNPVHLLAIVIPIVPGSGDPYLGWTVLVLAAIGVLHGWRQPGAQAALGVGLLALLYSFGPQTPLHGWVYELVPLAERARGAGHALFLFALAAFILAARGLDQLTAAAGDRWPSRLLLGFAALAGSLTLAELALGRWGAPEETVYHGEFVMFSGLAALLLAAVLEAIRRGALVEPVGRVALVALLLLEGGAAHWLSVAEFGDPVRAVHLKRLAVAGPAFEFLKQQPKPFRFEMVPDGGGVNLGDWHGLESVEGYLTVVSRNVYDLMDRHGWNQGRDLLNTFYTVSREPTRSDQEELFRGPDGWNVYRNPQARPRAWLEAECGSPGEAVIVEQKADSLKVMVDDAACPGTLVLAEVWAPGWRARVDDVGAEVVEIHGALRGIQVSAGAETVELFYQPTSAILGAVLSATTLVGIAAIALRRRIRG